MGLRKIDPLKLSEKLKPYKLSFLVEKSGGRLSRALLSSWSLGRWSPSPENALILCEILECEYEDISSEMTSGSVAV